MEFAIEAEQLTKRFGSTQALAGVSLHARPGTRNRRNLLPATGSVGCRHVPGAGRGQQSAREPLCHCEPTNFGRRARFTPTGAIHADGHHEPMRSDSIQIHTGRQPVVRDLTDDCARYVADEADGLLNVFVPHATAGVAILETGAGSDDDLLTALDSLLPRQTRWQHAHGSPGHGRDHVLPALIAPSIVVPVLGGRLQLGTWQSICLVDTNGDNPDRTVRLSFLS
ncbi:MAG: hypothetical protein JWN95_1250 [Frankiales bacterium]|nr:hypothetical protein [Frankiales bacterium]